jgi:hypothetical protein
METFKIAFWGITATLNFLVGNLALGAMSAAILASHLVDDSEEDKI